MNSDVDGLTLVVQHMDLVGEGAVDSYVVKGDAVDADTNAVKLEPGVEYLSAIC